MLSLIICGLVLLSASDTLGSYRYSPGLGGWLAVKKVKTTWNKARQFCHQEGAVLASPINEKLLGEMIAVTQEFDLHYYTGFFALDNETYVSLEGVPLENTPLANYLYELDPFDKQCLVLKQDRIFSVPCNQRYAYMCFRKYNPQEQLTECGTYDKEYKLNPITGSCYKYHKEEKYWNDAYATCINEGGSLVVINDQKEADVLKSITFLKQPLIGVFEWQKQGVWRTVHGDDLNEIYNVWQNGSMPSASDVNHRCVGITGDMKMVPYDCQKHIFTAICEKDPKFIKFN